MLEFNNAFEACHEEWGLKETLKVHILQCHIDEYLEMSGKTCWSSNDECVEAVHQLLERRNLRHWLKKTKNLIGSCKRKYSAMSMNLFQAKNMRKKRK